MLQLALHTGSTAGLAFIEGIAFDPFFRGLLSVLAGVVVLIGGTYLLVATNTGTRLGFLVSLGGLFGWLFLMGIVWTIYGIGWAGQAPTWHLLAIDADDAAIGSDGLTFSEVEEARTLAAGLPQGGLAAMDFDPDAVIDRADDAAAAATALEDARVVADIDDPDLAQDAALVASRQLDLDGWRYLVTSDATRGEAQSSVDAFLVEEGEFEAGGYVTSQFGAFITDGKPVLKEDANVWDRVVHTLDETVLHPFYDQELMVVQVQGVVPQATLPGQPPPVATADPDAPVLSVIMERDRGGPIPSLFSGLRFTPAMFTLLTGSIFAVLVLSMHLRDRREAEIRAQVA
jgi:hypothetical protein